MSEIRFDGQACVVTGAGRGLGKEYALLLAKRGASVVVNNRTPEKADEVVAEIKAFGGTAVVTHGDVQLSRNSSRAARKARRDCSARRRHTRLPREQRRG